MSHRAVGHRQGFAAAGRRPSHDDPLERRVEQTNALLRAEVAELEDSIRTRRALAKAKPWIAARDDATGRYYFLNTLTGEAQWHRPRSARERQAATQAGLAHVTFPAVSTAVSTNIHTYGAINRHHDGL